MELGPAPQRKRREFGPSVWISLGPPPFRRKMPDKNRWIALDFLGFSRPNRAFSMACARFSQKENSCALFRQERWAGPGLRGSRKAQRYSSRELNLISDYLQ
jgi:hypothetical protein